MKKRMLRARTRRIAYIWFSPESLAHFCMNDPDFHVSIQSQIPKKARFVGAYYDDVRHGFRVYFEHGSFREIKTGELIPYLPSPIIRLIGGSNAKKKDS